MQGISRRSFLTLAAATTGFCAASGVPGGWAAPDADTADGVRTAKMPSVSVIHFSPTGSTARIANYLGNALAASVTEFDLGTRTLAAHSFDENAFAVAAVPVYAGRVPGRAAEALRLVSGNGAHCVSIAVYGNRAPDDALLELNDILAEQGFRVAASGAFVAQHSLLEEIATGRPDAEDLAALDDFARAILEKSSSGLYTGAPAVPGNRPYRDAPASQVVPVVADSCTECGLCADQCPVSAIPEDNLKSTSQDKCMLCMRCVRNCPAGTRDLPPQYREKVTAYLRQFSARRLPETYL